MGIEYQIIIEPQSSHLEELCATIFAETEWKQIPTSLLDIPNGLGVQYGEEPEDPSWPHVADLYLEQNGHIYIVCHNQNGVMFLRTLAQRLESRGHKVAIRDI